MNKFGLDRYTMDRFLSQCLIRYGSRPFLAFEGEDYISYKEFGDQVRESRILLMSQGLKKGDGVAFLGAGSPRWAVMWMAAMTSGLVAVPVMEDFPASDVEHILLHSGVKGLCLETRFLDLNLEIYEDCDFLFDLNRGEFIRSQKTVIPLDTHVEISEGDPAEYMYTSGTTGFSKGVILTHGNLVSNLFEGTDLIDNCFDKDSLVLSLLPMGHTFGSTSSFLSTMYKGPRIAFLKRKPTVPYLKEVFQRNQPTILGAVPLIFEKIYQKQVLPIKKKNSLLFFLLSHAGILRKIFHRAAAKKIMDFLGGRIRCIIIGGAPFSPEVEKFMKEGKIPYVLGYGLTETSPLITFCSLEDVKTGSVGHCISDTEIRIVNAQDDGTGDIEVRGPQVMAGYLKDPEATSAMFTEDHWLKTGDKGYLDHEGFLYLRGRTKNVILSSSGENIYPESIEALLTGYPCVEEVLVHLENQRLVARVYPNYELIKEEKDQGTVQERLDDLRKKVNEELSSSSFLYQVIEQKEPFIKTPTKKIKRNLYSPEEGNA